VLVHGGVKEADVASRLDAFKASLATQHANGAHRLSLARAQDRIRWELTFPLGPVSPGASSIDASQNLASAFATAVAAVDAKAFFTEAERVVTSALSGSIDDMLRELPGKGVLNTAARTAGMSAETYTRIVREGIRGELGNDLRDRLVAALSPRLPERKK
jgi:hypothetical protein